MTLDEFKAKMQPSLDRREKIASLRLQLEAAIMKRHEDAASMDVCAKVVNAVRGNVEYGEDSAFSTRRSVTCRRASAGVASAASPPSRRRPEPRRLRPFQATGLRINPLAFFGRDAVPSVPLFHSPPLVGAIQPIHPVLIHPWPASVYSTPYGRCPGAPVALTSATPPAGAVRVNVGSRSRSRPSVRARAPPPRVGHAPGNRYWRACRGSARGRARAFRSRRRGA
jgi:hypothetical protein